MNFHFFEALSSNEKTILTEQARELSKVNPTFSMFWFGFEWALIITVAMICEKHFTWSGYVLSVIAVGSRQHALAVLAHEGAHGRPFRSRRFNTIVCNILAFYPLLHFVEIYGSSHWHHHRHTNGELDPEQQSHLGKSDWKFPMSARKIGWVLCTVLVGRGAYEMTIGAITDYFRVSDSSPLKREIRDSRWIWISFYLIVIGLLTYFESWGLWFRYWMIPLLFTLPVFLRLRNMSEHYGLNWNTEMQSSRDVDCNSVEAFLLAPHGVNYHLTHHLFPSVPFYNLKKMHINLMKMQTFRDGAHVNRSYVIPIRGSVMADLRLGPEPVRNNHLTVSELNF